MATSYGTLDQWRALQAVVDNGGYAQAASRLNRSQSTVNYAVSKLEKQLGIQLLEVQGRKALLTEAGQVLLERSRLLLKDAVEIGQLANSLSQGREAEIQLVVDAAFPTAMLMESLKLFATQSQGTRVQLREVVLSGACEALVAGEADLVIAGQVPPDFLGNILLEVEFVAVAHPDHALHQLNREISTNDIRRELQVVIRDSGVKHNVDTGWLGAEHRWTVTSIDSATAAVSAGLGFAWLPRHQVQDKLDAGELKLLPLDQGLNYVANLYLIFGKPASIGPATRQLADIFSDILSHNRNEK